jgi:hypothetical protein
MSSRVLIFVVFIWVLLLVVGYYLPSSPGISIIFTVIELGILAISLTQIILLIHEWKSPTKLRLQTTFVLLAIFFLTIYNSPITSIIEKIDWFVLYNKRLSIVEKVKQNKLNPNVSWNNWICELDYEFPIVSNGGNDIGISRNPNDSNFTVTFFMQRNFVTVPSICFVYTNDPEQVKHFDRLIVNNPDNNWKIEDNWYRTFEK